MKILIFLAFINTQDQLSRGTFIAMLIIGFFCLILSAVVIFLYIKKIKREKNNRASFAIRDQRTTYKMFYFWSHIIYLFIFFALIIGAIILLTIAFGSL